MFRFTASAPAASNNSTSSNGNNAHDDGWYVIHDGGKGGDGGLNNGARTAAAVVDDDAPDASDKSTGRLLVDGSSSSSSSSSSSKRECHVNNKIINTNNTVMAITMVVAAGVVGLLVTTCTSLLKSPSPSLSSSIGRPGMENAFPASNLVNYNTGEMIGLASTAKTHIVRDRSTSRRAGTNPAHVGVDDIGAKTTRTTMNAKKKQRQVKNKKIMKNVETGGAVDNAMEAPPLPPLLSPRPASVSKTKGPSSLSTLVLVGEDGDDSTAMNDMNLLRQQNDYLQRRIRDLEVSNSHLRQRLSKMTQERNSWKSQYNSRVEVDAKADTKVTTTCQQTEVLADKTKKELDQKDRIIQYLSSALSIKSGRNGDRSGVDTSKKHENSKSTTTVASYSDVSEDNVKDGKNAIITKPSIAMIPVLPPKQRPITSPMKALSESSSSSSSSSFPASPPESWSSRFSKSALSTFWNGTPMASTGVDSLYLWQRYLPSSISSSSSSSSPSVSSSSTNTTSYQETGTMKMKMLISKNQSQIFDQHTKGKLSMLGSLASKALAFYSKSTGLVDTLETRPQEKKDKKVTSHRSKMDSSTYDQYYQSHDHDRKNQKSVITVGSKAVMATAGPN